MRKLMIAAIMMGLLFVVAACGKTEEKVEKIEKEEIEEVAEGITVTDLQGNTVEFDKAPERIVSLIAGDLNTLYDLGATAVGRPVIRGNVKKLRRLKKWVRQMMSMSRRLQV